ncbi:MAG: hypothetical protein ACI9NT_002610, partial [Bacteroidia bacterium]
MPRLWESITYKTEMGSGIVYVSDFNLDFNL